MYKKITPIIKELRKQGGTLYTFSSALEDIGLNINERNNVVRLSKYALLNIPNADTYENELNTNNFNFTNILGNFDFLRSPAGQNNVISPTLGIAQSFQNYALNMETCLMADMDYNPSEQTTVSERVFWKWLKESGAIRFESVPGHPEFIREETVTGYNRVVKAIGEINAGSFNINNLGSFNETYIQIPTSYGETNVFFKQFEDVNYYPGKVIFGSGNTIMGRDEYPDKGLVTAYYDYLYDTSPKNYIKQLGTLNGDVISWEDNKWWYNEPDSGLSVSDKLNKATYIVDAIQTGNNILSYVDSTSTSDNRKELVAPFLRSTYDCMSIDFNIKNPDTYNAVSFDDLAAIKSISNEYEFNAILIYYNIYNQKGDVILATNLLGVLFIDAPEGSITETFNEFNDSNVKILNGIITIPSFKKVKSSHNGFGTAFSARVSIQSNNLYDDTSAEIIDTTDSTSYLNTFGEIFNGISKTLSKVNNNSKIIADVEKKYFDVANEVVMFNNALSSIKGELENLKDDIKNDNFYLKTTGGTITGKVNFTNTSEPISLDVNGNINIGRSFIGEKIFNNTGHIKKENKPFISSYKDNLQIGENLNSIDVNNKNTIFIGTNLKNDNLLQANENVICIGSNMLFNEVGSLRNTIILGNNLNVGINDDNDDSFEFKEDSVYIGNNKLVFFDEKDDKNNHTSILTADLVKFAGYGTGSINNVGAGTGLVISEDGQILKSVSSKRYKNNIKDLSGSSHVYDLRPVTYEYKSQVGIERIGLIAEEVELIDNRLVNYNAAGKVESVNYELLSVLLLSELKCLKEKIDILNKNKLD